MLPLLLGVPYAIEASTALMVLYIRYGPAIMAALSESPMPMNSSAVRNEVAKHSGEIASVTMLTARHWYRKYSRTIGNDTLGKIVHFVASTQGDMKVFQQHLRTHLHGLFSGPRPTVRLTSEFIPPVRPSLAHHAAAQTRQPSSPAQQLLERHGLRLVKADGYYILQRSGAHVMYVPQFVMERAHLLLNWLHAAGYT